MIGPNGQLDEGALPGNMSRVVLALLVHNRAPVSRARIADTLWPDELPRSADASINSMISHIRAVFVGAGFDGRSLLTSAGGSYMMNLPVDSWIDTEDAMRRVDRAHSAARSRDWRSALPEATVASGILARPFLEGFEGAWAHGVRRQLGSNLYRCYDVLSEGWTLMGDPALAADIAERAIDLDPLRETGYRRLIEAEHARGDTLGALHAFDRCERVMRTEFGAAPSEQTIAAARQSEST